MWVPVFIQQLSPVSVGKSLLNFKALTHLPIRVRINTTWLSCFWGSWTEWNPRQSVRVRGTYGTDSQSSRHSHLDWTGLGLVANKQRKDRMPHIWDLTCVPVPRSTAGTYLRMQAVKNKNKKIKFWATLAWDAALYVMSIYTWKCQCTHVYMRVLDISDTPYCMRIHACGLSKSKEIPPLRPYGIRIRDSRIIPAHIHNPKQKKNNRHHMCCSNCPLRSTYSTRSITFSSQLGSTVATIRRGKHTLISMQGELKI